MADLEMEMMSNERKRPRAASSDENPLPVSIEEESPQSGGVKNMLTLCLNSVRHSCISLLSVSLGDLSQESYRRWNRGGGTYGTGSLLFRSHVFPYRFQQYDLNFSYGVGLVELGSSFLVASLPVKPPHVTFVINSKLYVLSLFHHLENDDPLQAFDSDKNERRPLDPPPFQVFDSDKNEWRPLDPPPLQFWAEELSISYVVMGDKFCCSNGDHAFSYDTVHDCWELWGSLDFFDFLSPLSYGSSYGRGFMLDEQIMISVGYESLGVMILGYYVSGRKVEKTQLLFKHIYLDALGLRFINLIELGGGFFSLVCENHGSISLSTFHVERSALPAGDDFLSVHVDDPILFHCIKSLGPPWMTAVAWRQA